MIGAGGEAIHESNVHRSLCCDRDSAVRFGFARDGYRGSRAVRRAGAQPISGLPACLERCYDGWACRYRYDDFHADVEVAGNWGWGDQQLGTMQGYADFQLAGAQTTSKPVQYTNTAYTTGVVFSGNLLNSAPGVAGDPVDGTFSVYNAGDVVAGGSTSWLPNGYKSYDNTMWDHSQVIEWAFSAPDYPGYWYLYAKSTCTHTSDKVIYRFDGVDQVPADPDGAGWNE
jgi:hypothetical protein